MVTRVEDLTIRQIHYRRSPVDKALFNTTMGVIQGGVGPEYAEDANYTWQRLRAQRLLETAPERMTPKQRDYMAVPEGQTTSPYRCALFVGVSRRDRKPKATIYGSQLVIYGSQMVTLDGEPFMFMGYAALQKGVRDPDESISRRMFGTLVDHLNNTSLEVNGKPLTYAAIEIERGKHGDKPLARRAMEIGAFPLALPEDNKGYGYTGPEIDAEKHRLSIFSAQRLQLFFGRLGTPLTVEQAANASFDPQLIASVCNTIFDQEYRDYSPELGAGSREQSFALKNTMRALKGLTRVVYDLSDRGIGWINVPRI